MACDGSGYSECMLCACFPDGDPGVCPGCLNTGFQECHGCSRCMPEQFAPEDEDNDKEDETDA